MAVDTVTLAIGTLVDSGLADSTRLAGGRDIGIARPALACVAFGLKFGVLRKGGERTNQVNALGIYATGVKFRMLAFVDDEATAIGQTGVATGTAALVVVVDEDANLNPPPVSSQHILSPRFSSGRNSSDLTRRTPGGPVQPLNQHICPLRPAFNQPRTQTRPGCRLGSGDSSR